jgi:hypothetical protein
MELEFHVLDVVRKLVNYVVLSSIKKKLFKKKNSSSKYAQRANKMFWVSRNFGI